MVKQPEKKKGNLSLPPPHAPRLREMGKLGDQVYQGRNKGKVSWVRSRGEQGNKRESTE
jgi:hypothetical protein